MMNVSAVLIRVLSVKLKKSALAEIHSALFRACLPVGRYIPRRSALVIQASLIIKQFDVIKCVRICQTTWLAMNEVEWCCILKIVRTHFAAYGGDGKPPKI
jgi:hypothetical protein